MNRLLRPLSLVPWLLLVGCVAVARPVPGPGPGAGAGPWIHLGGLHVADRVDRDTLHVGADEGAFSALRVRVERHAVRFHKVEIHYRNGRVQKVSFRVTVAAGRSRTIDLVGSERFIDRVVFVYDAKSRRRGVGARIEVYGRR